VFALPSAAGSHGWWTRSSAVTRSGSQRLPGCRRSGCCRRPGGGGRWSRGPCNASAAPRHRGRGKLILARPHGPGPVAAGQPRAGLAEGACFLAG